MRAHNFATVAMTEVSQAGLVPGKHPPERHLLVVDDEPHVANTLAAILRAAGYGVTVAYDAESAIGIAALAPPHLLVTDFNLPGRNGVELALAVQVLVPDCRVVMVTGVPDAAAAFLATSATDLPVFAKPVELPSFLAFVSELLQCGAQPKHR